MVSGTVYLDKKKKRWVVLGVRKHRFLEDEFVYTYLTYFDTYTNYRIFSMNDDMLKELIQDFLAEKTDVIQERYLNQILSVKYLRPFHYVLASSDKVVDKVDLTSYIMKNKLLGKEFDYFSDNEVKTFESTFYDMLKKEQKKNEYLLGNIFKMYYRPVDGIVPLYYNTKENAYYKYSKKEKMYYPVYFVKSRDIKDILCARQKLEGKRRLAKIGKSIKKDKNMLGCVYD